MYILNFSHPLTDIQVTQIERLTQLTAEAIHDIRVQFDVSKDFVPQTVDMIEALDILPDQWQKEMWLIVLPSLNFIAAIVLAELHGRTGRFPSIVRLRPVPDALVSSFEVAEIINLDTVRNVARVRR